MMILNTYADPFGQVVRVSSGILENGCCRSLDEVSKVITTPAYLIETTDKIRYYFRLTGWEHNIMIRANPCDDFYLADECMQNPSKEFISSLLDHGSFYPFATLI